MIEFPPNDAPAAVASERLTAAAPTLASLPNVVLVGYPISGWSRRAVRAQINEKRPDLNGRRHDASTLWRYSTRIANQGGTCLPASAQVTVAITVTMPDYETPDRLSRADLTAWRRYFAGLENHEANHARIANLGAERMQAAMRAVSSCDQMQEVVNRIGAEVSAASEQYDLQTRHGATEGAQF